MEPYEKASERLRKSGETAVNIGKNIGLTALGGGTAIIGTQAVSKLIPGIMAFVNKYVPENLAIKGLEKLDPRFGKLIQGAMGDGYTFDDIKNFLGEKIEKSQEPQDNRNVIEQHSPELNTFLSEKIKGGEDPIRAAALALFEKGNPFERVIRKIEKEHKTNWSALVQSIYGGGQGQGQPPVQQLQQQALQSQPMQPQGQGQGAQSLKAILQRINQRLGG